MLPVRQIAKRIHPAIAALQIVCGHLRRRSTHLHARIHLLDFRTLLFDMGDRSCHLLPVPLI